MPDRNNDTDSTGWRIADLALSFDGASSRPSARTILIITAAFWAYVTMSDVLYAEGARIHLAQYTNMADMVYAPWPRRLLQHALMFPLLFGCYWTSCRIGWTPALRRLPVQLALAVGFCALPMFILNLLGWFLHLLTGAPSGLGPVAWPDMALGLASLVAMLPGYGFGLALISGAGFYRKYHGLQLRNARLKSEWAGARLAALRTQLSPHTLFNVLHTIQAQIAWEPAVAQELIASLAALLRGLLQAGERDFVLLADELHFAEMYLGVQCRRFGDRLTVKLPPPGGLPALWVPSLILQPLIENALVHGLGRHSGPVSIEVATEVSGDTLRLRVVNSTAGTRAPDGEGIGLRNVRERLAVQFGESANLRSGPVGVATWLAEVTLPVLREWRAA